MQDIHLLAPPASVVDEGGNTVTIRYFVDAGQRAYVRRVSFRVIQ